MFNKNKSRVCGSPTLNKSVSSVQLVDGEVVINDIGDIPLKFCLYNFTLENQIITLFYWHV